MPSRKDRLRAFIQIKKQRKMLGIGVVVLAILAIALSASLWRESVQRDTILLGKGAAAVNSKPEGDLITAQSERSIGTGEASFYGPGLEGNRTASGESFDSSKLTAAHRTLAMGSRVRVTNPSNGESVIVRINDRGPFHGNRVIDLSVAAAREIGLIASGTGQVQLALILD